MFRTPLPIVAATVLVSAALGSAAAFAGAAEITYIDQNNVYVENLDGSARHALSTDGTPARPYVLPTADEQGSLAAFQANAETGQQEIVYWTYGTGTPQRHRMPRTPGDQTTSPPTSARMQPDGATAILGYTFLSFGDPNQPRHGRTNPNSPGLADAQTSIDYTDLTWFREKPVVARPEGNIYWTGASKVMLTPNTPGMKLTFAEISADGTRVLVRMRLADGTQQLGLFAYENDLPPYGDVTSGCALPIGAGFAYGALSRDGKSVAWDDAAGVHVAQADPYQFDADSNCVLAGSRTVSSTARMPSFSEATTTAPAPAPGGGGGTTPPGGGGGGGTITTPGGSTGTPQKPGGPDSTTTKTFKITLPSSLKAISLRRGLSLKATTPGAGRLTITLKRGSRTLASGTATVRGAGSVKVRLTSKRGARLAGRATLAATFTPKGGKATRKTATVQVR
ncbi:hypothetical protein [Baekduia sp. Peel2402]|uniref:hypothetical protein n=1 Tax=Baekduia sp. Peel2402 TaxID=3458296 RepID=UPI00403E8A22